MKYYLVTTCLIITFLLFSGCQKEEPIKPEDITSKLEKPINSCEGCHTNYGVLKATAEPDPPSSGGGGCGGDVPHIEPFDRVYLNGDGYTEFKKSFHGNLDCTVCHNGVDNTDDKEVAHSGNFISHPSSKADEKCANCHPDEVINAKNSLHQQGWGQKEMVFSRAGLSSFDQLSEMMKNGYDENCGKCHASCGDCHVNRPVQGGGGLYKGHQFSRKPDMRDVCVTCHVSRGGHAYFGIASGTVPDVHLTKAGFECMDCHSNYDVHGDGNKYNHRYEMSKLPKCTNCHSGLASSNKYHTQHLNTFNCNTCHSQDYNNCGSCHIGGEGARIASHQKFKIGMNPIASKPFKFATLRQSLSAPDSWQNYGIPQLANFNSHPTYKYTTPHNTIRWTSRTKVADGTACYDACHIIKEGDTYRNKELYLFESDLQEWEIEADKKIVVDQKLPSKWEIN
ncbi:MAG: hypothetical protein R6W90_00195 [Ignavibacteriaceae bacterium]